MSARLAILGAGGHARVVADAAEAAGWQAVYMFDDRLRTSADQARWSVLGTTAAAFDRLAEFVGVIVGIGANTVRLEMTDQLIAAGGKLTSVIHPSAMVSPNSSLGEGSLAAAGAIVNVGARTGRACIVNTGASVDHDCELGHGVHVSPGARLAGGVRVGSRVWVGIGAVIREGVTLGDDVIVGAGAVVVRDVAAGVTVVGNPARPLER